MQLDSAETASKLTSCGKCCLGIIFGLDRPLFPALFENLSAIPCDNKTFRPMLMITSNAQTQSVVLIGVDLARSPQLHACGE